jgi:hypothetical protein
MSGSDLDISGSLTWEEGLPLPQWDLIDSWIESNCPPDAWREAWVAVGRQWLAELGPALGGGYEALESDNFLALVPRAVESGGRLLPFAERCRAAMQSALSGVANFDSLGKQLVVSLPGPDHYYRYITLYYPEGEHGGSAGVHIREGYPHVALHGKELWRLENSLAHELTHVSLHHLSMPQWLEEGLAQMFEHDMTGRLLLEVDAEMAGRHKRYWGKHGLDAFWRGEGFSRPGTVQELSYQLAEILVRLLVEESRPRWFGWVQEPRLRFFAFLRGASAEDCGEAACQEHLRYGLSDLAARFLGPGSWSPSL